MWEVRSVREGRNCTMEGSKAIWMTSIFILRWAPLGHFEQRTWIGFLF